MSDAVAFDSLAPNASTFIEAFLPWIALIVGVLIVAWVVSLAVSAASGGDSGVVGGSGGGYSGMGSPGSVRSAGSIMSRKDRRMVAAVRNKGIASDETMAKARSRAPYIHGETASGGWKSKGEWDSSPIIGHSTRRIPDDSARNPDGRRKDPSSYRGV